MKKVLLFILLTCTAITTAQTIIYVKADAAGSNNGTSWTDADTSLQTALTSAVAGDQIWVARGTYKPTTPGGDRSITFNIPSGVAVYGHFAGTETSTLQRLLTDSVYATILSGDLDGNDTGFTNNGENSYHVVTLTSVSNTTILDGLTISHGNDDRGIGLGYGGGIFITGSSSSPTLRNCTITLNFAANDGGGIFIHASGNWIIDNCSFIENKNYNNAGAIEGNVSVNLQVTNSNFSENSASTGACVYAVGGSYQFTNCTFSNNSTPMGGGYSAGDGGPALFAQTGTFNFTNCSFTNNWANAYAPALNFFAANATIDDCTFRGNYTLEEGVNVPVGQKSVSGWFGATGGGAIYSFFGSTLKVTNSVFENNTVWGGGAYYASGGAILNINSYLLVEDCLFRGNFADGKGGAINSCVIENDSMNVFGSSLYFPYVSIINSCFTGNVSNINGGAVSIENNKMGWVGSVDYGSIINCTINGNYVEGGRAGGDPTTETYWTFLGLGGGLYFSGTPQLIKNTIVWGNSASDGGNEAYYITSTDSIPEFYYSDIKGSSGSGPSWNTAFGIDSGGNKDVDPAFISSVLPDTPTTTSGNVRFLHSSPAANAGNNSYVTLAKDLDGNTRIQDGTVDMGAYESSSAYAPILYVNASAQYGSNEGTSWANAYTSLQTALNAAVNGDQIWVAKGTYKPSYDYGLGGGSRYYHFEMKNGVSIYGGFAGTEDSVKQRTNFGPGGADETKLSGDLNGDDIVTGSGATLSITNNSENCYHVIYNRSSLSLTKSAVLNGFTIQGGFANGLDPYYNRGGGMFNDTASPTITNVTFTANEAKFGGGLNNYISSSPALTNCIFYSNLAFTNGGAIENSTSSSPVITNSTIAMNRAFFEGGALNNYLNSSPIFNNSIVWGDTAGTLGKQFYISGGGTVTMNYSCYSGSTNDVVVGSGTTFTATNNNITSDPLFVNATGDDFRIMGESACADAGYNGYNSESYDIRGSGYPRKVNKTSGSAGTIDMGAYEFQPSADPLPVELTTFTAASTGSTGSATVLLKWETATEVNNYGFDIERQVGSSQSAIGNWEKIGFVQGSGNSNSPKSYSFVDLSPLSGNSQYRLKQIDNDGSFKYSSVVKVTTLPKQFSLGQNYPNPFNPTTTISFSLPVDSKVELDVYNTIGQRVANLANGEMQAGYHNVEFNASRLASGIYFYRITAGSFNEVKKLILLK
ncbi:MAG: choice-of-anchor Q domain-containing protein [Ignavibacteriaceae bacterium]